ncbi:receptor-type tyrosine-protein phosphatase beta-like [Rana temporaria]|uniref:receptor-type tyrosine-protein phosphatase beta-like n=1 Tax=Rana temporaria TaxID=8407 RepID=UPI001AADBE06|nr:receptor-type tyrosine-protein phosphatase beta-like [Rana temporaria]
MLDVITSISNVPSTILQSPIFTTPSFTTVNVPTTSSIPSVVPTTTSSPPDILTSIFTTTTSSPITATTYENFTGSSSTSLPIVVSGTDQLVISWTPAPGNVDYYIVFLGNVSQRVNSPTATFSALLPGTGYNVTVQAVSGNLTRTIAIKMVATYPTPPGNISHRFNGTDTVTLVWDNPVNMSNAKKSFNITVARNGLYRSGSSIYTSEATNVTVSGLSPGNYNFTIVTVGALQYTSTPKTVTLQLPNTPSPDDNHVGVIVGAVVGSVGGVIVIGLLGFLIWKIVRKREWSLDKRQRHTAKAEQFAEMFKMKERDTQGFGTEFSALQCVGALQSRSISTHPKNATKNHPEAVFPYDNSLVKLSKDGNSSNGYINASYIPGQKFKKEFIAAQSPLRETVNDFWKMIWEQNVTTVIMFSSCEEDAPASSEVYWPSTESRLFGNVLVTYVKERPSLDGIVREFTLTHVKKKGSFQVKQFQYTSWPVNSDLCEQELLINFVTHVVQHREQQPNKYPTLVHCRTGGSRCGIFIALSRIVTQLEMDNSVDVYNTVNDLLLCRPSMIQTKEEYLFLHCCTLDIIRARDQRHSDTGYAEPGANNIYHNESDDHKYETVLKRYNSRASDNETLYDSPIDV